MPRAFASVTDRSGARSGWTQTTVEAESHRGFMGGAPDVAGVGVVSHQRRDRGARAGAMQVDEEIAGTDYSLGQEVGDPLGGGAFGAAREDAGKVPAVDRAGTRAGKECRQVGLGVRPRTGLACPRCAGLSRSP